MNANPILLQKKYSRVIVCFARQQGISLDAALDFFYRSELYLLIRDGVSDMHCMSDAYLAEELEQEYHQKTANGEECYMELEEREDTGLIEVEWSSDLYGTVKMEAHYGLYQKGTENFLNELNFAREHFQQIYDSFLEHLFDEYNKNIHLDVWNEETGESERIVFSRKEELHLYLGMKPYIDIKSYDGKCYLGLSFFEHNRLSIEHGLCAVFGKLDLLFMDTYDFAGIINNLKYGYHGGF